ncbi:MAG: rod shape-determining protein MreC [Candidatus Dependentiae bacterium]
MLLNKKVSVIGLISILFFCAFFLPTDTVLSYISYPCIKIQQYIIDPIKRHNADNHIDSDTLQNRYDTLMQRYLQLQATYDFNQDVQELITFKKRYDTKTHQITQILQRHLGDDEQYVLLDKGARDGVNVDMIVVFKDMLVGKITKLYPLYCKCMLITDRRCKVAGCCAQTKACGVMQGTNSNLLQLLHVSHLHDIKQDDVIISSGHGTIFPRGFGLARVSNYIKKNITYEINCHPLVDFSQITYCSIIVNIE